MRDDNLDCIDAKQPKPVAGRYDYNRNTWKGLDRMTFISNNRTRLAYFSISMFHCLCFVSGQSQHVGKK